MKKIFNWLPLICVILVFLGGRIFNHCSAWGGIFVIVCAVVALGYYVKKKITNNTKQE